MKIKAALFVCCSLILFAASTKKSKMIFDFNPNCKISDWKIVNDDVMGGISTSDITLDSKGNAVFSGDVSTENYGGFASVRLRFSPISVKDFKYIRITLKGDNKNYQFRLKSSKSDYYSYIKEFKTSDIWETIDIKIADLYPSFRGRKLDMPNFGEPSFEEIAFLIANKKDESFELLIDKIELTH